jgi:5'-deoxynucleotidase YfbR-like HD superfamily hydrolase
MRPERAFILLGSGRRLDLLDPRPGAWTDKDLAVGLSRTYRWGGHSRWELPLSVAQHSLLVLALRQAMQPHQPLTPKEALRELLHDAEEALMGGFDPVSPLRPHLGAEFQALADRLRSAVVLRYGLARWEGDDLVLHKRADRLAAASEALHVVGWPREEIRDTLGIQLVPLQADPLPNLDGLRPWEPWPPRRAAGLFLYKLRELQGTTRLEHPAGLTAAIERERTLAHLGRAFQRLAPGARRRCARPVEGTSLSDTWVAVEADDISQRGFEGLVVDGERDEDGAWVLDGEFTVFTEDEELIRVQGSACTVEIL